MTQPMQRKPAQLRISATRRALTLVELLIVGAVIALLATLTLVAVNMAATAAKITKTRSTIQKLDTAMQQIFETYAERLTVIRRQVAAEDETKDLDKETQRKIVAHRIRDLMRMEMPQSWAEVLREPIAMADYDAVEDSPLRKYYLQHGTASSAELSSAELLFLIIQNLNPEALEAFHGSEVADTDGNGLLEFVDAWGSPIRFLRWAPAFSDSDLQQNVLKRAGYTPTTNRANNRDWWITGRNDKSSDLWQAMKTASINHPDPMDERIFDLLADPEQPFRGGWFLYPLIYSAGPDGDYGLDDGLIEDGDEGTAIMGVEGILDPFGFPFGMPTGSSHFDNIHNHQWYR